MKYRDFGKTGIKVSEVGFGCWAIGGNEHGISYGPTDDKESLLSIETAIDLGCNFFDTADVYGWGKSETLLGQALKGKRERQVIATKVGSDFYQGYGFQTFSAEYVRFALEKSLQRLKTDFIDVYQLHNPPHELIGRDSTYEILRALKKEGKVRAWGLTVASAEEGLTALDTTLTDCLQVPFNMFASEAAEALFQRAAVKVCAIIAREPLANGFLSDKNHINATFASGDIRQSWPREFITARVKAAGALAFLALPDKRTLAQAAIQWTLIQPEVSVVIAGVKTPAQAKENFTAADSRALTEEELASIANLQQNSFGL
ncbi:MAG: aldo/keto reductase [Candidatus Obscuribacterales bacterium]|nr:aldo/keto reductase [Candidatus Obscuribacterales bacterium]